MKLAKWLGLAIGLLIAALMAIWLWVAHVRWLVEGAVVHRFACQNVDMTRGARAEFDLSDLVRNVSDDAFADWAVGHGFTCKESLHEVECDRLPDTLTIMCDEIWTMVLTKGRQSQESRVDGEVEFICIGD